MDLSHIGGFGHSVGGLTISKAIHDDPSLLQAGLTFDIGMDYSGVSRKSFIIPFMHQIAATRKDVEHPVPIFELGENGDLVGIAPNGIDKHYSTHASFTDLSTIQETPVFITIKEYLKKRIDDGFDLAFLSHRPSPSEYEHYQNITYVLYIENDSWQLGLYESKQLIKNFSILWIAALDEALKNLPPKLPEDLSDEDKKPIQEIMVSFHRMLNQLLGEGDGREITRAINKNLLQFLNTFLKHEKDPDLKTCKPLVKNTYIKCGPGKALV
ncbi:hypothetical protein B1207_10460 [Legionella quinlivanii]|uniref:Uncharacterized protein n=1 Tax=Legionella quinlivanii TaxID=45073 RepID=A0A364LI19_9GAMM|nr:hypothetical protein [Legionella quinlivanii]RAP35987.1 hypothetical protein B1207_10460 [Legionella quinlivanii]